MTTWTDEEISRRVEGSTVPRAFLRTLEAHGDAVALRHRRDDGTYEDQTFAELADRAARIAGGLGGLGVGPGDRVVLMMRNRVEFHAVDLAVVLCGATPISLYNSSSTAQIAHMVEDCGAKVAIVEDGELFERMAKAQGEVPRLGHVVVVDGDEGGGGEGRGAGVNGVSDLAALAEAEPVDLAAAAELVSPDDLATVIYTSGTTGPSKGVMITHRNVVWTAESLRIALTEGVPAIDELAGMRLVSYLPMAHIAERMVSHYLQLVVGFNVTPCPALDQITSYTTAVKPEILFGVPRVFEKIYSGVHAVLAGDPERRQRFDEAVEAAIPIVDAMTWDRATDEQVETWQFLDAVAFTQVRELLGLDQTKAVISGAAPLAAELMSWFRAIGLPMSEIYGLSETSGPMTWAPSKVRAGSVGPAIPGCEVVLADDGEICCRGGNVFPGYLNAPEKTDEVLDPDGLFHSGDIGEVDDDGYYRIVDRKKELIVTAGGKNLSPSNLEAALKLIPLVGQAIVVGDGRPFVAGLVVLDADAATGWAASQGIEYADLDELARHPDVVAEIERGVDEVMAPFSNAERVKKVHVLGEEWPVDSDLLTPTAKLKRRGIMSRFAAEIDQLYAR
ncbi:MAG: AMP-dependent synthetase/ligase [Actinomycetota bacterium]|nr:AMP-dependent synthetase/ligase [Actinomycetota bacterium]